MHECVCTVHLYVYIVMCVCVCVCVCVWCHYREVAERSVQELKLAEVAIGMDDIQPPLPVAQPSGDKTIGIRIKTL